MSKRKEDYEKLRDELTKKCVICRSHNSPTIECCDYSCSTGKKLRWLETEYSDVTGWGHKAWNKEA